MMNVLHVEPVELSHFMKSECALAYEIYYGNFRPIFHEKWDEKVPRQNFLHDLHVLHG